MAARRLGQSVSVGFAVVLALVSSAGALAQSTDGGQQVERDLSRTYQDLKSYGYDKKTQFTAWVQQQLRVLDAHIAELERRVRVASGPARAELERQLSEVQAQRQKLARKAKALEASSAQAWTDLKWGVLAAMDKLEQAYGRASADLERHTRSAQPGESSGAGGAE
jgi:chromosome segregation ATPase